jgi:hypothetical protein
MIAGVKLEAAETNTDAVTLTYSLHFPNRVGSKVWTDYQWQFHGMLHPTKSSI